MFATISSPINSFVKWISSTFPAFNALHIFLICLLTPISIMIQQEYQWGTTLPTLLLICDVKSALDLIHSICNGRWLKDAGVLQQVLDILSFPSLFLFPLSIYGEKRHVRYLLWCSICRVGVLSSYTQKIRSFDAWLERSLKSYYNDYFVRMFTAIVIIFQYSSLLACIWFYISCQDRSNCKDFFSPSPFSSWVNNDDYLDADSSVSCYVRSLHFIMQTLLTVGYGDIHPVNNLEILFTLFVILNGALFYGYLISAITVILDTKDITTKSFRTKVNKIRDYFKLRMTNTIGSTDLETVKSSILRYSDYMNKQQFGMSEKELLGSLPSAIAHEVKMTYYDQLKEVSFFKEQSSGLIANALDKLDLITFEPDAKILDLYTKEAVLLLVVSGKVDLLEFKSTKTLHTFVAGDCIGDYNLIVHSLSADSKISKAKNYYCETRCYTTCLVLSYSSFCSVLREAKFLLMDNHDGTNPLEVLEATVEYLNANETNAAQQGVNICTVEPVEDDSVHDISVSVLPTKECTTTSSSVLLERKHRRSALASIPQRHSLCSQTQSVTETKSLGSAVDVNGSFYYRIELGVKATFVAHQNFLNKLEKTKATIDNNAKKKRMAGMLETYVPSSKSSSSAILPNSLFCLVWNLLLLVCILYYNLVVPLRLMVFYNCTDSISFSAAEGTAKVCLSVWTWSLYVDYLCDAVFLIDLLLQSRYFAFTSIEGEEERVISDGEEIFQRFRGTLHFYVDVFTILPLDLISLGTGFLLCFRALKVTTLLLLPRLTSNIQAFLDKERNFTISSEAVTVFYLGIGTLIVTVWMTTMWEILRYTAISSHYIDAFYWCFTTMTTTGYGDIFPATTGQTILNICCSFVGPITFAMIIAKVASYVKQSNVSTTNLEYRLTTSLQYLKTSSYLAADCNKDEQILSVESSGRETRGSFLQRASFTASYYSAGGGKYHSREEFDKQRKAYIAKKRRSKRVSADNDVSLVESMLEDHYHHLSRCQTMIVSEEEMRLWDLPQYLEDKTKKMVVEGMFVGCNIFAKCDIAFQEELMSAMQQMIVCKGTFISNARSPSDGMYFIRSGTVKIKHQGDQKCFMKGQGDCFLEKSLLQEAATGTHFECSANSDCELWFLSRVSFLFALHNHPSNHDKMSYISSSIEQLGMLGKKNTTTSRIERSKAPTNKFVVLPDSTLFKLWSALIVLTSMATLMALPFQIAFLQDAIHGSIILNITTDVVFAVDILLRMFFFAYQDQEDVITDIDKILSKYARSRELCCHIVSILPIDQFSAFGCIGSLNTVQTMALLRMNRLFRLYDIHDHISVAEKAVLNTIKDFFGIEIPFNAIRLVKLVTAILIVAHWFGSVFFIIANQYHLQDNAINWADHIGLFSLTMKLEGRSASQCIHSIYWAITVLSTVGYGDIVPVNVNEKMYNIILYLVGAMVFAMIIVNLQEIVSQLDVTSDIFKRQVNRVRAFVERESDGDPLFAEKVQKYYAKLWSQQRGASGCDIIQFMPSQLYLASVYNLAVEPTSKLFFVSKCSQSFQRQFISKLVVQQYLKGDNLFRNGECSTKLFLICTGEVALVSYDTQIDTLTETNNKISVRELVSSVSSPKLTAGFNNRDSFRNRKKKSSYQKHTEGFVGESEFFSRSCYACTGSTSADSVLYTIDFDTFWAIVVQYQMVNNYVKTTQRDTARMQRNSTYLLVQKINTNIANAKMAKMVSNSNLAKSVDRCLMPDSAVVQVINALCFLLLVLECICIPYFIIFPRYQSLKWQILLDALYVCMFGVDMYGKLYLIAVEIDGSIVTDPLLFRAIYLRSFKWDFVSTLPLSLFVLGLRSDVCNVFSWVRLLYLLRILSITALTQKVYRSLVGLLNINIADAKLRVLSTIAVSLYMVHVIACIFCFIGLWERSAETPSWITINMFDGLTSVELYLRSYYWGLYTITTVGCGSVAMASDSERVFAACVMILGSIVCATLSAMLSFWVETSDGANGSIKRVHEASLRFCTSLRLDKSVQDKINGYFKHVSDTATNTSETQDLSLLPPQLRTELILRRIWKNVKNEIYLDPALFDKTAQRGYILSLLPYFELYAAMPSEILLQCDVSLLLKERMQRTTSVCLLKDLFILRRGKVVSSIQQKGSAGSVTTASVSCNEILKLENILPMDALGSTSMPKQSYRIRLIRISTKEGVESRIRLVEASWFVDGTRKHSEGTVNVQSRLGKATATFEQSEEGLTITGSNESIVGSIHCGHSLDPQLTYHVGSISLNVCHLVDLAGKVKELSSDDSSYCTEDSSPTQSPIMKEKPSARPLNANRRSKVAPIVSEPTDLLLDVEEVQTRKLQPLTDSRSDSELSDDADDECGETLHEFSHDIIGADGNVVGTATLAISKVRLAESLCVETHLKSCVAPTSPTSPTFKRRLSDALQGLGSRSSTKNLLSSPSSPSLQRRVSGILLGSLMGSSPDKSTTGNLTKQAPTLGELIVKNPEDYSAIMYSEGYSHLYKVPVARLQEMNDFYMMTRESPVARVNKLPKTLK